MHDAPCSVLIARPATDPEGFPASVVVGVDGSPQAAAALEAARELELRLGAHVHPVAVEEGQPARALVEAAGNADLLVVGSRGLHGVRALGSVSERVAHDSPCSVLVVR